MSQCRIQDFPDGHKPQMWGWEPIFLVYFPLKLHENEKKNIDRGARPCALFGPANAALMTFEGLEVRVHTRTNKYFRI